MSKLDVEWNNIAKDFNVNTIVKSIARNILSLIDQMGLAANSIFVNNQGTIVIFFQHDLKVASIKIIGVDHIEYSTGENESYRVDLDETLLKSALNKIDNYLGTW